MTSRSIRLLGAGLLALVLGSGVAIGIAADRLWLQPSTTAADKPQRATKRARTRDPQDRTDRLMKRFQKKLDLDGTQEKTVRAALYQMFTDSRELRRRARPAIRKSREQARAKIRASLRPDQRTRYEKMLKAYLDRKARRRAKRRR